MEEDLDFYGPLPKPLVSGILDHEIHNRVQNEDGTISTIRTISFNDGDGEVLIPTVVGGKILPNEEAIEHYRKTGESFGTFKTVEDANRMADYLHILHQQKLSNETPKGQ